MRSFALAAAALVSVSSVAAETFTVVVGGNNSLTYSPTSVTAKAGDTIQFQFVSKNHTVTQSTFAKPCERMTTPQQGADSGFMFVADGATQLPVWSFNLTDASAPLWFYCAQQPHCSKGMVFAVNPTADKTFDAFQKTAMGAATNGTASTSAGGSSTGTGGAANTGGSTDGGATNTAGGSTATPTNSNNTAGGANGGNNGAVSMSMNAAGLVSIAGLVAGLLL